MPTAFDENQRDFARMVRDRLAREREVVLLSGCADESPLVESWTSLHGDLGMATLAVAERHGGDGATWLDVAAAVETLGADLALGGLPMVLAAVSLLRDSESPAVGVALAELREGVVVAPSWLSSDLVWHYSGGVVHNTGEFGTNGAFITSPPNPIVPCPPSGAVRLLVPVHDGQRPGLYLTGPVADAKSWPSLDTTVPFVAIDHSSLPAELVVPGDPTQAMEHARAVMRAFTAIEAAGASRALLERTIEHLRGREQFGQVLASMQALKHEAADLLRRIEPLRSVALAAIDAADRGRDDELVELATAAKVLADETYPAVALSAVQLHGAMGFTWELGIHHHYKRALLNRSLGGDATRTRAAIHRHLTTSSTTLDSTLMDTGEDPAVSALRAEVQEWLVQHRSEAPPMTGAHEPMSYTSAEAETRWTDLLRGGRWLCLSWPEKYGGRGLSPLEVIAVNEEFARAGVPRTQMGMGEMLLAPALLAHGTDAQKARLLPRILSGEDVYCQGFSEPGHGSDLARLHTRGVADGDRITVTGTKIWQSGAHRANRIFVLCRTDPNATVHAGISYVLLDMPNNGVTVEPIRMMVGDHGFSQVTLDGAQASLDDVVGGLGNGWKVAMSTLGAERAGEITSQHLGYLREFRELVAELQRTDRLDDHALDALTDLYLDVVAMKSNGRRVADGMRLGEDPAALIAIDKLNWSEYHVRFGATAMQLLGLDGLRRPSQRGYEVTPIQRSLLESPGRRIARGTNQIQRNIIAERVLGMPR